MFQCRSSDAVADLFAEPHVVVYRFTDCGPITSAYILSGLLSTPGTRASLRISLRTLTVCRKNLLLSARILPLATGPRDTRMRQGSIG